MVNSTTKTQEKKETTGDILRRALRRENKRTRKKK